MQSVPPPVQGSELVWKCRMARGKKRAYLADFGKDAVTAARWVDNVDWNGTVCQRWELRPETGRSHQLRFELARRGFSIVGDSLYGSKTPFVPNTIALRAVSLALNDCPKAQELGLPNRVDVPPLGEFLK